MRKLNTSKFIILSVLVLSLAIFTGCGKQQETAQAEEIIRPVRYQKVQLEDLNNNYSYSGSLKAEVNSNLAFRVAGKIDKFLVEVGDKVEQGEQLAQLDKSDYRLQVNSIQSRLQQAKTSISRAQTKVAQAQSGIVASQAQLYQAQNDYERIRKLYQNDNVSKSDYDKARTAKKMAAAKLEQTKAQLTEAKEGVKEAQAAVESYQQQLELAQLKLKYTNLEAPISGRIVAKHKEAGEVVNAGMPILTIDSDRKLEVKVAVDEDFISKINKGDQALVSVGAVNQQQIAATVTKIGRNPVGYQGNYPVTVKLDNPHQDLKAGMTALVDFNYLEQEQRIIVESTAVASDNNGNYVYAIQNKAGKYGKVKKVRVKVGAMVDQGIEVLSGLEEGALIVTKGVSRIADGEKVKLLD